MEGNWRDLFAFNKRERNGIFVLTTLISLGIIIQFLMPYFVHVQTEFDEPNIEAYLEQIRKDSAKWVAVNRSKYMRSGSGFEPNAGPKTISNTKNWSPHKFDPNRASISDWESVGVTKAQAKSINRYLDKGGKFKVKADVLKMYVINEDKFLAMQPYLLLPDSLIRSKSKGAAADKKEKRNTIFYDTLIVELNAADTTELKKLRGIGSYYARQIVYYREKLGGFYSITQLYEIENMREETVQKIEPFVTVDTLQIKKLHINSDEAGVLVRHPYITWDMAKRIQDHRDFDHRFKSVPDLLKFGLLTEELYTKLVPYIEL